MKYLRIIRISTIIIVILGFATYLLVRQLTKAVDKPHSGISSQHLDKPIRSSDANLFSDTSVVAIEESEEKDIENIPLTDKYKLDDIPDEMFTQPLGLTVAQRRTDTIIARLKGETLEDSLVKLDNVDDFYYPGFYSKSFRSKPFDTIQTILSNRRFIKLYDELKSKNREDQYRYLSETLNDKLSQYAELLSRFKESNLSRGDYLELARISDVPGKPRTIAGTRLAIQAISILCGALGNARMVPELYQAFKHPITGRAASLDGYDNIVSESLRRCPVFPVGIRSQTIWLISEYSESDKAAKYGLDVDRIIGQVSDDMVTTINIPCYQGKVGPYDLSFKQGKPIDYSYGSHSIDFLVSTDMDLLNNIAEESITIRKEK